MAIGKTTALALGLVGGISLGIWIGASVVGHKAAIDKLSAPEAAQVSAAPEPQPVATVRRVRPARPDEVKVNVAAVSISAPELHERLRPLLNRGADMTVASEGFHDAAQFATVAHAARNTEVPFLLLKHRVLNEGKSLADAIRVSKPDVAATVEADRARAEAMSDIAAIAG